MVKKLSHRMLGKCVEPPFLEEWDTIYAIICCGDQKSGKNDCWNESAPV